MTRQPPPDSELAWEFFRASGPGGQHRNKVETGVRLTHLPTGITVSATERRSQAQNRAKALERLVAALEQRDQPPPRPRRPTRPGPAARRRRLEAKRQRGQLKALRRRPPE